VRRAYARFLWQTILPVLAILGCGGETPLTVVPPPAHPARLVQVSEMNQVGLAGEILDAPMTIQVLDGRDLPVPGVTVEWKTFPGGGEMCVDHDRQCQVLPVHVVSDTLGYARVWFRPLLPLETTDVIASVPGVPGEIFFFATTAGVLIRLTRPDCESAAASFAGPNGSRVSVKPGTKIVWEFVASDLCSARIVSLIVPPGGEAFDSRDLTFGQRFSFTPAVPGTWIFQDLRTGASGELYVEGPPPPRPDPQPVTWRIHLARADGTEAVPLVIGMWPSWSPDGSRLTFQRDGHIYVVGRDGTGERQLAKGWTPDWSPDGSRIAFVSDSGIAALNPDGTDVSLLVRHDFREGIWLETNAGVSDPVWSPDGRRIVFEHGGDFDTQMSLLYTMNADGSNVRRLTAHLNHQTAEKNPGWSPDGAEVVFHNGFGLTIVPANGGLERVILQDYGDRLSWSPDGRAILYSRHTGPEWWRSGTWTVSPLGGPATVLLDNAAMTSWSRDGARIAFVRGEVTARP